MLERERFFGNKNYVFRKSLLRKDIGWPAVDELEWPDMIDGKPVTVVSKSRGKCLYNYREFMVSPEWCEEVEGE